MIASKRGTSVLISTVVATLMVFVVVSNPVQAAPLAPAASVGEWSYGYIKNFSVGPTTFSSGWTYEGEAILGYTVMVYDNNTSATTYEFTIFRTMGVAFTVRFCYPTCSDPARWANETYRAWESTTSFTNITNASSVQLAGSGPVPAVGVTNSTVFLRANLTEESDVYLPALDPLGPHTHYLSAEISGHSTVSFSPALGLFPIDLSSGDSWTSMSNFTAAGAAGYSYYYAAHAPLKNVVLGPVTGSESIASNGAVSLTGSYDASNNFAFGGVNYPAINLTLTGPFSVREGVIFVPTDADLFGPASQPWGANVNGTATAQLSTLDLKVGSHGHFDIVASSWHFDSSTADAAASSTVGASSGLVPAATATTPVKSITVQGQPESGNVPAQTQQCLQSGTGCPVPSLGPGTPRSLLGAVVVAGVVATIGLVLALAVVTRRRKIPPPVYPNAVLYPPGASSPSAPAGAPATPGGPGSPEDDPLDHLW